MSYPRIKGDWQVKRMIAYKQAIVLFFSFNLIYKYCDQLTMAPLDVKFKKAKITIKSVKQMQAPINIPDYVYDKLDMLRKSVDKNKEQAMLLSVNARKTIQLGYWAFQS